MEILPGLLQIRLPIPIRSLGSVFAYFAYDGKHSLLIDTGWPGEETMRELEASLSEAGFSIQELETVVVSHLHPDHFGVAEEIRKKSPSSKLLMHEADASWILSTREDYGHFMKELHEWLRLHGTPEKEASAMYEASMEMLNFFNPPRPSGLVRGGETIKVGEKWEFRITHTPGHTPGNICLYDFRSKTLFSGDHILPKITPNVSLSPRYDGNPLGDYIRSLESLKPFETKTVLPSHEFTFSNLRQRIDEIEAHHTKRLDEVVEIVGKSKRSAYEIAENVHWDSGPFGSLSAWERRAALMETLAHIKYLVVEKRLLEVKEGSDSRRKIWYAPPKNP